MISLSISWSHFRLHDLTLYLTLYLILLKNISLSILWSHFRFHDLTFDFMISLSISWSHFRIWFRISFWRYYSLLEELAKKIRYELRFHDLTLYLMISLCISWSHFVSHFANEYSIQHDHLLSIVTDFFRNCNLCVVFLQLVQKFVTCN